jgi:hypothetical protein
MVADTRKIGGRGRGGGPRCSAVNTRMFNAVTTLVSTCALALIACSGQTSPAGAPDSGTSDGTKPDSVFADAAVDVSPGDASFADGDAARDSAATGADAACQREAGPVRGACCSEEITCGPPTTSLCCISNICVGCVK